MVVLRLHVFLLISSATSQHTRTHPCDSNPFPTGCESWNPILCHCFSNPVNHAIPSGLFRAFVISLVCFIVHLSPTLSGPFGVHEGFGEQGQVLVEPSDHVATTLCPEIETSKCLMNLFSSAGPLVPQSPVTALGCLPCGQLPAEQTFAPPLLGAHPLVFFDFLDMDP